MNFENITLNKETRHIKTHIILFYLCKISSLGKSIQIGSSVVISKTFFWYCTFIYLLQ